MVLFVVDPHRIAGALSECSLLVFCCQIHISTWHKMGGRGFLGVLVVLIWCCRSAVMVSIVTVNLVL